MTLFSSTDPCFPFPLTTCRQLPVPTTIHVAKVLEHKSQHGPSIAVPRTRSSEVLATRNNGRGHLQRPQGRSIPQSSRPQIRYPLPNVRPLRQPSSQHVGPIDGRRNGPATKGAGTTAEDSPGIVAGRSYSRCDKDSRFPRRQGHEGGWWLQQSIGMSMNYTFRKDTNC